MGLKEILDEINRDADSENNEFINTAKIESDKKVITQAEEINNKHDKDKSSLESELKRFRLKLSAKADLDAYREKQKLEVNLIEKALEESYGELIKYLKENIEVYFDFLKRLIKSSIELIGVTPVSISLNKEDQVLFKDLAKEFEKDALTLAAPAKISGGVICASGDSYIDNSLENIFKKNRPQFLKMISEEIE